MTRPRVLVREPIAPAGIELLRESFDVDADPDGDLASIIGDYDALIVRSATKVTRELIARGTSLKVIGRAGVGVDNVDIEAATQRGVLVVNAPQSTIVSAAEHTIGLLLALARSIPQAHATLSAGRWERSRFGGIELAEKTLGIVGFGRIGQQVARRARGLGMHVVAFDPFVAPDRMRDLGAEHAADLEQVLAAADFLTLHTALTPESSGLIDADALARAKDGVRIVNVARGELIDEEALVAALDSGKVAGAALDVFATEPYAGPLLGRENVIVTPHLGASTEEAQDRAGVIVAEQVAAALEGRVATNAVNVPTVAPEEVEFFGPYLPLAAKLGELAFELAGGSVQRLELTHLGELAEHDTRLLTLAALTGALQGRFEDPVNVVNAPHAARERGIEVREESSLALRDFTNLIEVRAVAGDKEVVVAGTTIGAEHRPRLVHALGYEIEIELEPHMVFIINRDQPGRIGRVGTALGDAGINIATMAVSRNRAGGNALMVLTVDTPLPDELADRLRADPGLAEVQLISLQG
jgi:D-3-phosphoglycerate dehydrogenase